jgi:hypothetical protein
MAGGDHCPQQTACRIISATYNSSSLILFHIHIVLSKLLLSASLGHTCYLELARGTTYTLHVSPPCDGDPRAIPVVLKGPPMSFFNLVSIHLKLARVGHLLHAGELPGSPRCPVSVVYSMWFAIKTHVNVITVPAVEACTVAEMLVCRSILIRPSSTCMRVTCCLRPTYEVPMAKKSSWVSHTSSQMVRTCCLRSPSASLRPPPQLTSNCFSRLFKCFHEHCEYFFPKGIVYVC